MQQVFILKLSLLRTSYMLTKQLISRTLLFITFVLELHDSVLILVKAAMKTGT